jgi:hypothetical protein
VATSVVATQHNKRTREHNNTLFYHTELLYLIFCFTAFTAIISLGVLFRVAFLTCAGRILIRLFTRRRLYMDDGFLLFAFLNLIGGTGILYKRIHMIYLEFAVLHGDEIPSLLAFDEMWRCEHDVVVFGSYESER